jgi:CelD/BcsL family acetyltransferase involved in cellulose biosynthesis
MAQEMVMRSWLRLGLGEGCSDSEPHILTSQGVIYYSFKSYSMRQHLKKSDMLSPFSVSGPMSDHTIAIESFETLASYWVKSPYPLRWDSIFILPPWLEIWWGEFGSTGDLYLHAARQGEVVIGVAPLFLKGDEAFFIGSDDVCDCLDFIVAPGREHDFFTILLDDFRKKGIGLLNLRTLCPDSTVLTYLVDIARDRGYEVSCAVEDVSLELDLPPTWEEYLGMLSQKQRHEVRRKLRRIREAGAVTYRIIEDSGDLPDAIDTFLKLFRESNADKAAFMTAQRESFFRSLAKAMAQARLLRLGILELDALPMAVVMCFDYNNRVYLYNSGYDPQYGSLSVGLISKILSIKDSIDRGRRTFDFLKGAEDYKYRLGGREIPLYGCRIALK